MIKPITQSIPPVYVKDVKDMKTQHDELLNEEFQSLGCPRVTPELLLDLEALSLQKQILINKYDINRGE